MRKLLFFLILLPGFSGLQAQYYVESPESPGIYRSPILKFSPLSLIDVVNSIQFAVEYQTYAKQSLQHEIGYISSFGPSQENNQTGIRIRNEYRFYLDPDKSGLGGFYVAPELLFIHLGYTKSGTFGRLCPDANPWNCPYYEVVDYKVKKEVYAIHPKVGYQLVASRFVMDFYGGLGYRYVVVWNSGKPSHERSWDDDFFSLKKRAGTYNLPSMSLGLKIGYVLKRRPQEITPYYREGNY